MLIPLESDPCVKKFSNFIIKTPLKYNVSQKRTYAHFVYVSELHNSLFSNEFLAYN